MPPALPDVQNLSDFGGQIRVVFGKKEIQNGRLNCWSDLYTRNPCFCTTALSNIVFTPFSIRRGAKELAKKIFIVVATILTKKMAIRA